MNCKAKGSRCERKAKEILQMKGYSLVIKSGGSLGLFDLIGMSINCDFALLIQVKSYRMPGKTEMAV